MITGLFLTAVLTFINFVFGLLSGLAIATNVSQGIVDFINYTYQFNTFFPVDTALTVLHYTANFWVLIASFYFFKWLIHMVRGN